MRADDLLPPVFELLEADAAFSAVVSEIWEDTEREFSVPSLAYSIVLELPHAEIQHRIGVQFTPFTRSRADLATVLGRLYTLLHREVEWTVGSPGQPVQSSFVDRVVPVSAKDGVWSASVEYEFITLRQRYVA